MHRVCPMVAEDLRHLITGQLPSCIKLSIQLHNIFGIWSHQYHVVVTRTNVSSFPDFDQNPNEENAEEERQEVDFGDCQHHAQPPHPGPAGEQAAAVAARHVGRKPAADGEDAAE